MTASVVGLGLTRDASMSRYLNLALAKGFYLNMCVSVLVSLMKYILHIACFSSDG